MEAATIIDNIVDAYRPMPGLKAIALFGSRARGTDDKNSDINLMVVESDSPTQSTRAQIFAQLCDQSQPSRCRDVPIPADSFHVDGLLVNIWHINADLICERIASVIKGRRLENSVVVSILNESSILWDPKMQLQAWKNSVNPIPQTYISSVVPVLFSEVTHILESLSVIPENSIGPFFFQHELMAALTSLYEIIYLVNGQYLILSYHVDRDLLRLDNLPKDFINQIKSILLLGCDPDGLKSKHRRICLLTQKIGQYLEDNDKFQLKAGWVQLKRAAPYLFEFHD